MQFMLWIWVALTVVTAIVEFCTVQMVSIWFTAGSLAALIAYAAGAPYWAQIIVFVIVSLILLLCFRELMMKWLLKNVKSRTNSDALIDTVIKLKSDITEDDMGTAEVGDVTWNVIGKNGFTAVTGDHVRIVEIDGNKLVVEANASETYENEIESDK